MLKRLMLLLTTFIVLFAFVTYQPKKVDAFVSTSAKFVAQQVLKAVTKTSVDTTVNKMLLDEVLDEVKKDYAVKNGFKLIENGGQKVLVKSSLDSAEKKALKNEIDDVIEKQVYGNAPKWVIYADWFVGVGAVIMVGQLLYATVTGDFGAYISDLITQAMINLGWLTPAPKIVDGKQPKPDPVTFPQRDDPVVSEVQDFTAFEQIVVDWSSSSSFNTELSIRAPKVPFANVVYSAEITQQTLNPQNQLIGYPTGLYLTSQNGSPFLNTDYSPISISNLLNKKQVDIDYRALGSDVTVKYGSQVVYDGLFNYHPFTYSLPSTFDFRKYNKVIVQPKGIDPGTNKAVTRQYWISTLGLQPTLSFISTEVSNTLTNRIFDSIRVTMNISNSTVGNPATLRLGLFSSLDLAWSADALPKPTINPKYFGTPIVDPSNNKLAIPQKSVLPDGYTYDPSKQEIKSPDGQVVTDPTTIPEFNPDPVVTPSPDGNVVIDGEGTDLPVPPGGITPPGDGGGTGDGMTTGDPTNIEWDKLKAIPNIFTKKFPFSLPWDAKRFIDSVLGDIPEAKDIVVNLEEVGGVHIGMNITLPDFFDAFFDFTRVITLVMFDIGLIYGLYRLLGGAS